MIIVQNSGQSIKTFCETQWCFYCDSYLSFLNNMQFLPKKLNGDSIEDLVFDVIN